MTDRLELSFDIRREDWIEVNKACMNESPAWEAAARTYRRKTRRQVLAIAPFCIVGLALAVGRSSSTSGMYAEGAFFGGAFCALLYFALPRVNTIEKAKHARLADVMRADLSVWTGPTTITLDEQGVHIKAPSSESTLSWQLVAPSSAGGFVILQHANHGGTIIPPRAFTSGITAEGVLTQSMKWWRAAQLSHTERLTRYLADRDQPCPRCSYNLRGINGERCPECGEALELKKFLSDQL
jgi:hypothetical protein